MIIMFMEQEIAVSEKREQIDIEKGFKKSFVFCLFGQIFMMVGYFSNAIIINGVPQWISLLDIFTIAGLILFSIALSFLRKINRGFYYSFLTLIISLVLSLISFFGSDSTDTVIQIIVKGLNVSFYFTECIFHLYIFYGCYLLFKEYGTENRMKILKILGISYLFTYALYFIFKRLSTKRWILMNFFANKFFNFGALFLSLALEIFVLVSVILFYKYVKKDILNGGKNEKEETL